MDSKERCEGSQPHVHPCSDTKGNKERDDNGDSNPSFVINLLESYAQAKGKTRAGKQHHRVWKAQSRR